MKRTLFATITLAVLAAPLSSTAQEKVFKAGAATSKITPPLDDGKTKLVFAVADNLHLGRDVWDEAKQKVVADTGIPASEGRRHESESFRRTRSRRDESRQHADPAPRWSRLHVHDLHATILHLLGIAIPNSFTITWAGQGALIRTKATLSQSYWEPDGAALMDTLNRFRLL